MQNGINKQKNLDILMKNINRTISGQELSDLLSISRQAVSKSINRLKDKVLQICSVKGEGYTFSGVNKDCISPSLILNYLSENSIFKEILYYNEVNSTQKELKNYPLNITIKL